MKETKKHPQPEMHQDSAKTSMPEEMPTPKSPSNKKSMIWMIVAIVAIVALLGSIAYGYISMKNLNKKISDQQSQINELSNTKKTLEDAASAAATAATNAAAKAAVNAFTNSNFLEVKELGYKLPLSDDIKDLTYFVHGNTTFFSTRSLQASAFGASNSSPATYCSPGSLPLGGITKFANAGEAGPTQQKALNGFVLGYAGPQATCSNNPTTDSLQTKQKDALFKAFNNAQKI